MNSSSSQFMDKQILGLSGSQNSELFDLLNTHEEHNGGKKDEILPSYDFQPIRNSQSTILEASNVAAAGARVWNSADSKSNTSTFRNYGSLEPNESTTVTQEKDRGTYDTAMMSEIDRTVKKHTDNLLRALEGVGARFSQLESRTRDLENSVDDLKATIGNNHGSTDGRLRQLENILRELQIGVQVLRDKQEVTEAQLHLAKLQASQGEDHQPTENQAPALQTDSLQQTIPPPQQSLQQPLPPPIVHSQLPPLPTPPPNAPPPPPPQQNPPTQLPHQLSQNQIPSIPSLPREPYFPPPGQPPEPMHQQYQLPPQQPQPQPPQPQHYQAPPQHLQYSQPPQPANPPQMQPLLTHQPEETSYIPPSQMYPPRQPSSLTQPPSGAPPSQQFYGSPTHMYEPSSRPMLGQLPFSSGYNAQLAGPNFNDPYPYSGPPSQFSSSAMKPPQVQPPSAPSGGNSSYPRLPTAQILPQALPAASSISGGSGSGGTGNRVPIDDVVDKVTKMGFSRDQVRATVRKLTENGQSVDLNVVLDKLTNDGEVIQPQKGWFGR